MFSPDRVYSLDIETDNSQGHGLNPAKSRVTEISVLTAKEGVVFNDADEKTLLVATAEYLRNLAPGLISTWNGAVFDMPFISDRMVTCECAHLAPRLAYDPGIVPKYDPLPGHAGGYIAVWASSFAGVPHQHLDISGIYKPFAEEHGVKHSLKPVCAAHGIEMVELDRTRLHTYSAAEREAYVHSDTYGTRELTLRALGLAA